MKNETPQHSEKKTEKTPWHSFSISEVLERLESDTKGLSASEADSRLEKYGPNELPQTKGRSALMRFLAQFNNVLIYLLLAAAVITGLLAEWLDMGVILGVVLVNAMIGFIQEGKAEKSLDSIRNMLSPSAVVLRDGKKKEIEAKELVPGDVILLNAGDKIPADIRLFKSRDLQIEEAALTGESVPVEKDTEPVDKDDSLGDRSSMAFSGTMVAYGQGRGLVVGTGSDTEIGRISEMLSDVETLTTPLLKQLGRFGNILSVAIIAMAGVTFAFGYFFQGFAPGEMFMAAVGLAVAAIPEGLPAIVTITLAIGVQRMAKRNAIIRHLPAVETLGSVSVICTDKTGTLTRNEMTVQTLRTRDRTVTLSGVGYAPEGDFQLDDEKFDPRQEKGPILDLLRFGLLCNEAEVTKTDGNWKAQGAPTESALITAALKAGLDQEEENDQYERLDAIPFSSEQKFMATLHRHSESGGLIILKGAPEKVLERCSTQRTEDGDESLDPSFWEDEEQKIASKGQRLLGLAIRPLDNGQDKLNMDDVAEGFIFLGLYGIIDPPRDEAVQAAEKLIGDCESMEDCDSAGIRVKMITGDHVVTATAIGLQLGIGDGKTALTGKDIESMSDEQLQEQIPDVDIFARVSPEHKLRIVTALQAKDKIVAMTGDGVNDAPALKRADVGVAMGQSGTEAAKESSDMVLADDNFASIANAVEEGRTVYDNIKKAILFILPTNGGQALVVIAAIFLGIGAAGAGGEFALPISPPQILWINMVTAVSLALALAFEPAESNVMRRPPRKADEPLVSRFLLWRISFVSLLLTIGALGHYVYMLGGNASQDLAATVAINTLVFGQVCYLFNSRFIFESSMRLTAFTGSTAVLWSILVLAVLQLGFTYAPPMQFLFRTEAVDLTTWLRIFVFGVVLFLLVEGEKYLMRRYTDAR
ncbi:potassium and/or sodium efflux P-type ATPase [Desulfonatronum thiosulfatophilum]|uniref:Potassium and/or sodium efflux P-type ATPase n=2 Tax=Desulfonatronum thiosulfatophilum TaxID=617002 RepID=A0A1G6EI01_9BACT|nr:potassium and/or sodium efflux P-type ATPase [Desulfonatronum thiosulfatophilum]